MVRVVSMLILLGCGARDASPPAPVADPQRADPATDPSTDPSTDSASSGPDLTAAAELYAQCHDRLELPESAGECSADADCTPAGCSQEICTTPAAAAGMMSMCDMQPCFAVVKDCGCVQGRCTWSLQPPAKLHKLTLPH